jgi:hypothetical protein
MVLPQGGHVMPHATGRWFHIRILCNAAQGIVPMALTLSAL